MYYIILLKKVEMSFFINFFIKAVIKTSYCSFEVSKGNKKYFFKQEKCRQQLLRRFRMHRVLFDDDHLNSWLPRQRIVYHL